MLLLNGKKLANRILSELKSKVARMPRPPVLVIVTVNPNEATKSYLRAKEKAAERVGVKLRIKSYCHSEVDDRRLKNPVLKTDGILRSAQDDLQSKIIQDLKNLNGDPMVDAILVQLPLPKGLSKDKITAVISAEKDAEKESPTALGIMRLLDEYRIPIKNKKAVIFGAGCLVGQPLTKMMERKGAKVTTIGLVCKVDGVQQLSRIYPKPIVACRMSHVAKSADILVSCTGCPKIITGEMMKPGAVVVDCGSPIPEVDFETVSKIASAITPVPGGVGPMTVAMLMEKTVEMVLKNLTKISFSVSF